MDNMYRLFTGFIMLQAKQTAVVKCDSLICSVVTVARICNSVGGGVFYDMQPWWRWRITGESISVKARVVNWKQVDVAASRSFQLSWKALIAHCMRRHGVH